MNTIIHPLKPASRSRRPESSQMNHENFRKPHYDCTEQADTLRLDVYVPGVDASAIEITARGPDLIVTAKKSHFVRVNWQSLHLEGAQRDYRLVLRLGNGLDYTQLQAELRDNLLKITLPKKASLRRNVGDPLLQRVA